MVPCRSAGRNYRKGRHKTMSDSEQPSTASQAVNEPSATTPPMLTSKVPIPPNIKLKGDLKQTNKWKQIWDAYELVTNLNQQSNLSIAC